MHPIAREIFSLEEASQGKSVGALSTRAVGSPSRSAPATYGIRMLPQVSAFLFDTSGNALVCDSAWCW
jgi:hypothetical protein